MTYLPDTCQTFLWAIVAPCFALLVLAELIEGVDLRRCWTRPVRWALVLAGSVGLLAMWAWLIRGGY